METIASDSGTLGGKHRSSQFLASVRCLSAVLQKVRSSPASGRHAPSLPGCCPQVTHTASSALSGAHPPGWRCTFPSRPPCLSPQPGRFWGPGSPAPWRPWLVRHGVERGGGCAKVRGSAAAPASGSLLPARLTWPLAGPAPSVLHLGRGSRFCRDWLWSHKTRAEPQLCRLDSGCMSSFWQSRLPSSVRWI